jgi:hypothetical protein
MTAVAIACLLGCTSKNKPSTTPPANNVTFKPIEGSPQLTEALLTVFEGKHQLKLPADYRALLLKQNGGFPTPDCVTFDEAGRKTAADVFCLHRIGPEQGWASVEWHLKAFEGRLPKNTIPVAHDSCGNLWLLRVDGPNAGGVHFWDHGSYDDFDETDIAAWPRVATSFQAFLDGLHAYKELPEEDKLLSRYAMVQKAVEGMKQKSPDFDKYKVVDVAWHCDVSDDGKAKMQAVKYQVHAIATHTDGYTRLRAAKGLITEGKPRLPQ